METHDKQFTITSTMKTGEPKRSIIELVIENDKDNNRLWSEWFLDIKENDLSKRIAEAMKPHLLRIIKEVDTYSIHCMRDSTDKVGKKGNGEYK